MHLKACALPLLVLALTMASRASAGGNPSIELCEIFDEANAVTDSRRCSDGTHECAGGPVTIVINGKPTKAKYCQLCGLSAADQLTQAQKMEDALLVLGACRVEDQNGLALHTHACSETASCSMGPLPVDGFGSPWSAFFCKLLEEPSIQAVPIPIPDLIPISGPRDSGVATGDAEGEQIKKKKSVFDMLFPSKE